MTVRAELHDGTVLEFPDGTADEVVSSTVKRLLAGQQSTQAPPAPPPAQEAAGKKTGGTANLLAGAYDSVAGLLGFVPDVADAVNRGAVAPATHALSDYAIRPLLGMPALSEEEKAQRAASVPRQFGTSEDIRAALGAVGAPTGDNTAAVTTSDRVLRGTGSAIGATVAPHMLARSVAAEGATPVVRTVLDALRAGSVGGNAAIGGVSGLTGAAASENVDDPSMKPLADMAGQMVGGGLAAVAGAGLAGAARGGRDALRYIADPLTDAGRRQMAAEKVAGASSDPVTLRENLDTIPPNLVPGSEPTLYQLTGDMGIGGLERGAAANNPAPFIERRAAQNASRVSAVNDLAPDAARPEAVGELFNRQLQDITDRFDGQIAAASERRSEAVGGLAGFEDRSAAGGALRQQLEKTKASEKAMLSRLYAKVDPDETLSLDVRGIKETLAGDLSELPKAAVLSPEESRLYGVLQGMPDVEKFREIGALRSELMAAIRDERVKGETPVLRRLQMFRQSIDNAMGDAAGAVEAPAASPVAVSAPSGDAFRVSDVAYTQSGRAVPVRYEVVEGDTLKPASGDLQPRDRTRAVSDAQITKMTAELQPGRLGPSADLGTGAPLAAADGTVVDGNGRYQAIMAALKRGGGVGQSYRDQLSAWGFNVEGMRNPVLVRRPAGDLPREELVSIAREANAPRGLDMAASERAALDAKRLTDDVLSLYRGGSITDAANQDMVRAFASSLDQNELGSFVTRDRGLSVDGARRLRTALTQRAYGDAPLVEALAESGDEAVKAFGSALSEASASMAALRAAVEAGRVRSGMDISAAVVDAARLVREARSKRVPLADVVAQVDAFNAPSPETLAVLRAAYGDDLTRRINKGQLVDFLNAYAVEAAKNTSEPKLFASEPELTPVQIMDAVAGRVGKPTEAVEAPAPVRSAPVDLTEGGLTPTFDGEARARYRTAQDAYRDYSGRFKTGSVGDVLRAGRGGAPYNIADAQAADKFWNAGPRARTDVAEFAAALDDNEKALPLLSDTAAQSLRAFAVKEDGTVDPRRWMQWLQRYGDALRGLEDIGGKEAVQRFRKPGEAQKVVDALGEARTRELGDIQNSAARFFLKADPVSAVGSAFRSKDPAREFADLARMVAGDADARNGLKRAVVEYMKRDFQGNELAGTTTITFLKSDKFQTFVNRNEKALRWVFGSEGLDTMKAVSADLQRANKSVSGTKLPGGSNTTQDITSASSMESSPFRDMALKNSPLRYLVDAGSVGGGAFIGGVGGAMAAGVALSMVKAARRAGAKKVDELVTQMLLEPEFARQMLKQYPPRAKAPPVMDKITQRLGLVATSTATTPLRDRAR